MRSPQSLSALATDYFSSLATVLLSALTAEPLPARHRALPCHPRSFAFPPPSLCLLATEPLSAHQRAFVCACYGPFLYLQQSFVVSFAALPARHRAFTYSPPSFAAELRCECCYFACSA